MPDTSHFGHGLVDSDVAPAAVSRAESAASTVTAADPRDWRDFVAGDENRLAFAAVASLVGDAVRAVEMPFADNEVFHADRSTRSPLVLHGPPGTGKSHLCDALVRQWRMRLPADSVAHLSAVEFAEQYAAACETDAIDDFRRRFREVDLLVLEDVARLAVKPQAQWELLNTLDALERRGASVVVTLSAPPAKFDTLLPGLVSRFDAGLVVGLVAPGPATRRRILERLADVRRLSIEPRALELLAADLETTVPQLGGALATLAALADDEAAMKKGALRNAAPAMIDAAAVRRFLDRRGAATPTFKAIAEQSARHYGLKTADLKSASRRRTVVAARDAAVFLARRLTGRSFQEIGAYFGGRDHTTIMHSHRKLEEAFNGDAELRETLEQIRSKLQKS